MEKSKTEYNIDTMVGIGKKMTLAGREYEILPINIEDMHYIIGEQDNKLILLDKEEVEKDASKWLLFGYNIIDAERKAIFLKIISKYVFYKEKPMTEKLLIEHNWSFKEIGQFLYYWTEQVSE